jgi:hypothetical protein
MSASRPLLLGLAGAVVMTTVGWLAFSAGQSGQVDERAAATPNAASPAAAPAKASSGSSTAAVAAPASAATPATNPVGTAPSVRPENSANAASIVVAAQTGRHPERMSLLIAPKPFDRAAFAADPQAYLDVIEPGRVFQSAEPGPSVPVLDVVGTGSRQIAVGGSCELAVKTAPLAPVTYTTMDLGTFQNGLTTITVRADAEGVAKAVYAASGGVIADVSILVGSPLASGQVQFHVFVTEPTVAVSKP